MSEWLATMPLLRDLNGIVNSNGGILLITMVAACMMAIATWQRASASSVLRKPRYLHIPNQFSGLEAIHFVGFFCWEEFVFCRYLFVTGKSSNGKETRCGEQCNIALWDHEIEGALSRYILFVGFTIQNRESSSLKRSGSGFSPSIAHSTAKNSRHHHAIRADRFGHRLNLYLEPRASSERSDCV